MAFSGVIGDPVRLVPDQVRNVVAPANCKYLAIRFDGDGAWNGRIWFRGAEMTLGYYQTEVVLFPLFEFEEEQPFGFVDGSHVVVCFSVVQFVFHSFYLNALI
jgi:hypothetical protein